MAKQNPSQESADSEASPLPRRFLFLMVLLALGTFGLQVRFFILNPENPWSIRRVGRPNALTVLTNSAQTVLPGNSVVWKGEVWVSVIPGTPVVPRPPVIRAKSAQLVEIDRQSRRPVGMNLMLSPAPLGLLVVDQQMWAVSETTVFHIQNNQAIQRNPRRALIQPTKPFIYQGRLAVIDKNRSDVYSLLTWNEDEWFEVGQVEAPITSFVSGWFRPELRVISYGETLHLFFFDGQQISYREGVTFVLDSDPVSALSPENSPTADPLVSVVPTKLPPNWQYTLISVNWSTLWDVAFINDELHLFCLYSGNSAMQRYQLQNGLWMNTSSSLSVTTSSFSIASGSPSYLVTDVLELVVVDGSANAQPTIAGRQATYEFQNMYSDLGMIIRYSLAIGLLLIGTWWLMRRFRSSQYVYGKRNVIQASVLRRCLARCVDSILTVLPAWFWLSTSMDGNSDLRFSGASSNDPLLTLLKFFLIFGLWVGSIVVISVAEGCWGFTPGKWLLGIRTLRTTLRPCGILRALVREMLVYVDSLFFLTWIPGVLLIAFSKNWQRLGDFAADTVVVLEPQRQ